MAYVDLELKKKTRNSYNKLEYAIIKEDPVLYEQYLEKHRQKKRNRVLRNQDKRILEAAKTIYKYSRGFVKWEILEHYIQAKYILAAAAVLYPERIKGE